MNYGKLQLGKPAMTDQHGMFHNLGPRKYRTQPDLAFDFITSFFRSKSLK